MMVAGHTFVLGLCGCGKWRADLHSDAREAIARGQTLVSQDGVAHVGQCAEHEWPQIVEDMKASDLALERAMAR